MKIWTRQIDVKIVNERGKNTMSEHLGITFTDVGDDFIKATMPISDKNKQPYGIMHGGASCVLAETIGSTAANFCVDEKYYCVGLDINTNHIRAIRSGIVEGVARPYHLGKSTQVWHIEIRNEEGKLISVNRLTMAVLERS